MRESDRDRPDDRSTAIEEENDVPFNQVDDVRATDGDDVRFDKSVSPDNKSPTDEDALDAPEAMPIVPEQISLENAAFVVLGVALTVVVILSAI